MTVLPVWFGPADRPLFGWFHAPSSGRARAAAVLCAPFARDYTQSHFALRLVAEKLEAQEIAVLRFDYDGMGDSAGNNDDPDRVAAWLRSTADAIAFVRSAGAERVSLVGMRIGATLAAWVAADDGGVDQLVLWDPSVSGRAFLREQQAVSALTLGVTEKLPDGSIDTPGLVYRPEVIRDLRKLRLEGLPRTSARRVLVLTRADRDPNSDVMAGLGSESVEHAECVGQAALMDVGPPFQKLPYETIDLVADWVSKGSGDAASPIREVAQASAVVVGRDPMGRAIVERPVFVAPAGLFGMLTEVPGASDNGPVALFLSVANEHHIGPARLWVDLARRWAGFGLRGLRLDMSGLGESPVRHPEQQRFVARAPEAFVDIADAARAVSPDNPQNVLLVGLCSSAYQAIDSALELRPAGVVVINPVLRFIPAEVQSGLPMDPRRTAALPRKPVAVALNDNAPISALRRRFPGLRRRVRQWAQPGRQSSWCLQLTMGLGWRARMLARPRSRPSSWLQTLVGNGTDVLLVAGERETRPIRFGSTKRLLARLARTGKFRFDYIPDLDHALLIGSHRDMAADIVTAHLVDRFASCPTTADPETTTRLAHQMTARSA